MSVESDRTCPESWDGFRLSVLPRVIGEPGAYPGDASFVTLEGGDVRPLSLPNTLAHLDTVVLPAEAVQLTAISLT